MIRCQSELFQSSVKLVDGLKMNTTLIPQHYYKIFFLST